MENKYETFMSQLRNVANNKNSQYDIDRGKMSRTRDEYYANSRLICYRAN